MSGFLVAWYAMGWVAVCMRPYAAKNFTYIMQTLSLCELVGVIAFGWALCFVYLIFIAEHYFETHPVKCLIIWRAK